MARRYRILLTKRFADDLQSIFDYIATRSAQNAPKMISRILDALERLKVIPHRTVVRGQPEADSHPVRSLPVGSYMILFRVFDEHRVVRVLCVRHGARRPPDHFD